MDFIYKSTKFTDQIFYTRFGICKQKAIMYKGSTSIPATNLTYNPPINGQPHLDKKTENETELMLNNGEYV